MALDFALSDEQKQIQISARNMLKKFEGRREEFRKAIFEQKKFPQEIWDAIAEAGFLGALIPEAYGGNQMGLLALEFAVEEMGRKGFGNAVLILTSMDTACIVRNGSEELKKRYLPKIAGGKLKFCFAVTEPDAGSNTFRIKTHAKKDGAGYRITGQKTFITGADVADRMLLVTRTTTVDECKAMGVPKAFGLSLFIIDPHAPGVTLTPIPTRGIEGHRQFQVFMDGVKVGAEDLVGEEGAGAMALFNSLNPERILAAAGAVGVSDYLLEKASQYANERKVFGDKPIGSHQGVSHPLAHLKIEVEACRLLTQKAAWAFDAGLEPGEIGFWANCAKYKSAETWIETVDRAIQTLGGYGFSEEYGIIHLWESARLLRTAPISKEMILNYVAEHSLGLPKSY